MTMRTNKKSQKIATTSVFQQRYLKFNGFDNFAMIKSF